MTEFDRVDRMTTIAQKMFSKGADIEQVLQRLRSESEAVYDTVRAIRTAVGLSLTEAKVSIDRSSTWADKRDEFREIDDHTMDILESDSAPVQAKRLKQ